MGIKLLDPQNIIKIVSITDDAIDRENCDMVEYSKKYDISLLKFLADNQPTYFYMKNVMSTELVAIQQDHYIAEIPAITPGMTQEQLQNNKIKVTPVKTGEMLVKYFKSGCDAIEIEGVKQTLTDDLLNRLPPAIIQEMGSFIMMRSNMSASKKK